MSENKGRRNAIIASVIVIIVLVGVAVAGLIAFQNYQTAQTVARVQAEAQATASKESSDRSTSTAYAVATVNFQQTGTADAKATASQEAAIKATSTREAAISITATFVAVPGHERLGLRAFGPVSGSLEHEDDAFIEVDYGPVRKFKNFGVEATFYNPYGYREGSWDYGFLFRDIDRNQQHRLIITSNGYWEVAYGLSGRQHGGKINVPFGDGPDAPNTILLIAEDELGTLYINQTFVAEFRLTYTDTGYVAVGTGFLNGDEKPGKSTRFEGFSVWQLR